MICAYISVTVTTHTWYFSYKKSMYDTAKHVTYTSLVLRPHAKQTLIITLLSSPSMAKNQILYSKTLHKHTVDACNFHFEKYYFPQLWMHAFKQVVLEPHCSTFIALKTAYISHVYQHIVRNFMWVWIILNALASLLLCCMLSDITLHWIIMSLIFLIS